MTTPRARRELSTQREHRRRRERINQQRRRARLAGKTVTAETTARISVRLAAPPAAWQLPGNPACSAADMDVFFGPEHESPQARARRLANAQAYCLTCPVRRECLDAARDRGERYGIWGGAGLEAERKTRPGKAARPGVAAPDRA